MKLKDYQVIASALRPFYALEEKLVTEIIQSMSLYLKKDNPKFNPVKFLDLIRGYGDTD